MRIQSYNPDHIYIVDPNDHSRVVNYYENLGHFIKFIQNYQPVHEIFFYIARDYCLKHGNVIDNRHPRYTRDPRFACSIRYFGYIYRYTLKGEFIEKLTINEFLNLRGVRRNIGTFIKSYGYPEYKNQIYFRIPQANSHWDFCKYDYLDVYYTTIHLPDSVKEMILNGQLTRVKPGINRGFSKKICL